MNAFIYAAGRATRLGPAAQNRPKLLIEFGGRSLLEWHVIRLKEVGVGRIRVITGFLRPMMQAAIFELATRYSVDIEEIYNPDFQEGSVLSMAVSLPQVEASGPSALLLDGDVLYGREMLARLISSPHRTALLVDRGYSAADDDPVLVPINAGRPFDFVKRWRGEADQLGESIGFFKVAQEDIAALVAETRSRESGAGRMDSYDEVIRAMVRKGLFGHEDVTGLPWTEIDFPEDVRFANEKVLPALLESAAPIKR